MSDQIKNQLDQIAEVIDSKIEKANGQVLENAKGQIDSVLKGEVNSLTEKHRELYERLDAMEVASKKAASNAAPKSLKSALESMINEGVIEQLRKGNSSRTTFEVKAGDMTIANSYTGVVAAETVIPQFKFDPSRATHIRSLIPLGSTDAAVIRFPKETAYDDGAGVAAGGTAVGQSDFDITAVSVNVEKLGTFMRITEEMLNDTPQLTAYLSARVPGKVLSKEDQQILNGTGASNQLDGFFTAGNSAAFNATTAGFADAVEAANEYDVLVAAMNQLNLSNYSASTILLNPTDLHKIVLLKSTANEYLRQQIYQGLQPTIMGIPVTVNTAVTTGNFLVGDLGVASQLWIRDNLAVEFSREDSTNFRDYFVTVRVQERLAHSVYQPNAVITGDFSSAKAALETP
jgi:HK97 family phage major capsid protein